MLLASNVLRTYLNTKQDLPTPCIRKERHQCIRKRNDERHDNYRSMHNYRPTSVAMVCLASAAEFAGTTVALVGTRIKPSQLGNLGQAMAWETSACMCNRATHHAVLACWLLPLILPPPHPLTHHSQPHEPATPHKQLAITQRSTPLQGIAVSWCIEKDVGQLCKRVHRGELPPPPPAPDPSLHLPHRVSQQHKLDSWGWSCCCC